MQQLKVEDLVGERMVGKFEEKNLSNNRSYG